MNNTDIQISVVIPCLNEAKTIGDCIRKAQTAFQETGLIGEVIVSDNGSTDRSAEISKSLGAEVVQEPLKGYGQALKKGIETARGEFIIMGDADDSYDFSDLPRFVEKWREGYELVMGTRLRGEILPRAMPWHHRWIGNPVLTGILNFFFHAGISDAHCGLRGFTKAAYQKMDMRTTGMEFASELVIKAAKLRLKITEIPITLYPARRGRPPHLRSFHDGWRHLRFMLMLSPDHLFLVPGIIFFLIGLFLILWLLPGPRFLGKTMINIHTMIFGMIFILMGLQIIFIGLFAKIFSYTEKFVHEEGVLGKYLRLFNLEMGLLLGCILSAFGLIGGGYIFIIWVQSGFGPLSQIRPLILFLTAFLIGVEIIFSSFFLSMLGISRDTYIGDYEKK